MKGYLIVCGREEISSTGLERTMQEEPAAWETYRVVFVSDDQEHAERGSLIFDPESQRGGISWGADPEWTDAKDAAEVLSRYCADEMVN